MKYAAKDNQRQQHTHTQAFFGPTTIQPKLTIGAPHDKYEQEADQVANRVMKMDASSTNNTPAVQPKCAACEQEEMTQTKPLVQKMGGEEEMMQTKPLMRKAENGGGIATPALSSKLRASKGSGRQLPAETNSFMSKAIGSDFSHVNVHTGREAIQMNQGINARAFTHGSDIYFNQGEYSPHSNTGKKLLAHELTHVVQQRGSNRSIHRKGCPSGASTKRLHFRNFQNDEFTLPEGCKHFDIRFNLVWESHSGGGVGCDTGPDTIPFEINGNRRQVRVGANICGAQNVPSTSTFTFRAQQRRQRWTIRTGIPDNNGNNPAGSILYADGNMQITY